MKAFLCTWLSIIFLTISLISRDREIGLIMFLIAAGLMWAAGA